MDDSKANKFRTEVESFRRRLTELQIGLVPSMKHPGIDEIVTVRELLSRILNDIESIHTYAVSLDSGEQKQILLALGQIENAYKRLVRNPDSSEAFYYEQRKDIELHHERILHILAAVAFILESEKDNIRRKEENEKLHQKTIEYQTELEKIRRELNDQKNVSKEDAKKINELRGTLEESLQKFATDFENRYEPLLKKQEIMAVQDIFTKDSSKYKALGRLWLSLTLIFVGVLILTIACVFFSSGAIAGYHHNANFLRQSCADCVPKYFYFYIAGKLFLRFLLFSVEVYLISLAAKSYFAAKHNQAVYSHKANSLAAAVHLLGSVSTDPERQEIMKHAANAIFSHQRTGYLTKEGKIGQSSLDALIANLKGS